MTTAFIIVDVQNDFTEGGSLPVTALAEIAHVGAHVTTSMERDDEHGVRRIRGNAVT